MCILWWFFKLLFVENFLSQASHLKLGASCLLRIWPLKLAVDRAWYPQFGQRNLLPRSRTTQYSGAKIRVLCLIFLLFLTCCDLFSNTLLVFILTPLLCNSCVENWHFLFTCEETFFPHYVHLQLMLLFHIKCKCGRFVYSPQAPFLGQNHRCLIQIVRIAAA